MAKADSQEEYEKLRDEVIELSRAAANAWRLGFGFVAVLIGYTALKFFDLMYPSVSTIPHQTSLLNSGVNLTATSSRLWIIWFLFLAYSLEILILYIAMRLRVDSENSNDRLGGYLTVMHDRRFFYDDPRTFKLANYGWHYWNRFEKLKGPRLDLWNRFEKLKGPRLDLSESNVPELKWRNRKYWRGKARLSRIAVSKATDLAHLVVVSAIFLFFQVASFFIYLSEPRMFDRTIFWTFLSLLIVASVAMAVLGKWVEWISEKSEYRPIYWTSRWKEVVEILSLEKTRKEFESAIFERRKSAS